MNKRSLNVSVDELADKVGREDLVEILREGRDSQLEVLLDETERRIQLEETANQTRKEFCIKAGPLLTVRVVLQKITGKISALKKTKRRKKSLLSSIIPSDNQ